MGLSQEGYRTGGRTVLRVDLILQKFPPKEEDVFEEMRKLERRDGRRALPIFQVKWFPGRRGAGFYPSETTWVGEQGVFGLMDHSQIPLLEAVKRLGMQWVDCMVEGEEDVVGVEVEEGGQDAGE